jgi:hypothetical protein
MHLTVLQLIKRNQNTTAAGKLKQAGLKSDHNPQIKFKMLQMNLTDPK